MMMLTTTATATATAAMEIEQSVLSAAPTPSGSAYSSPASASAKAVINKALAPKKLLPKREEPRAHTHIKARTFFPDEPLPRVRVYQAPVYKEDEAVAQQVAAAEVEDAQLARELPPIPYTKKDKYGAPYFRAWAPPTPGNNNNNYAGEDQMVALVENYHYNDCHKEAPRPMEYMHFKDLNKHVLMKDHKMKEVPTALKYGAHLMFKEDPKHRANRIETEARLNAEADAEAAANPGKT